MPTGPLLTIALVRNVYQLWQQRHTGLYYGVRLEGGRVAAITDGYPKPPRALSLPALPYRSVVERPPSLADPCWRLIRLSVV